MVLITLVTGAFVNQLITGGPHIEGLLGSIKDVVMGQKRGTQTVWLPVKTHGFRFRGFLSSKS